jgi:branched-chain amino acid transport system ATP-binding protein
MRLMLRINSIDVFYRKIQALRQVSIKVDEKEMVLVLGANGAGKTTLLKSISGVCPLSAGSIEFFGSRIDGADPSIIVRSGICHCPEGRRVFPNMTVRKNLFIGAHVRRDKKQILLDFDKTCKLFPILAERCNQLAGSLSGGEQQMLAIARALMGSPRLLILDEPSLGLAPLLISSVANYVKKINEEGVTILLVEQNSKAALSIAQRGYVMERGQITLEGTSRELMQRQEIIDAYLGK